MILCQYLQIDFDERQTFAHAALVRTEPVATPVHRTTEAFTGIEIRKLKTSNNPELDLRKSNRQGTMMSITALKFTAGISFPKLPQL